MTSTKKDLVLKYYENNIGGRKDFIDTVGFSPEEKVRLLRAYDSGLSNLRKMVDNSVTIAVEGDRLSREKVCQQCHKGYDTIICPVCESKKAKEEAIKMIEEKGGIIGGGIALIGYEWKEIKSHLTPIKSLKKKK